MTTLAFVGSMGCGELKGEQGGLLGRACDSLVSSDGLDQGGSVKLVTGGWIWHVFERQS
jgi:hypothetical protein